MQREVLWAFEQLWTDTDCPAHEEEKNLRSHAESTFLGSSTPASCSLYWLSWHHKLINRFMKYRLEGRVRITTLNTRLSQRWPTMFTFLDTLLCSRVEVNRCFAGTSSLPSGSEINPCKKSSSVSGLLFVLLFDSEDGDGAFLRNVCWISQDYMVLYLTRHDGSINRLYKLDRSRLQQDPWLVMRSTQVYGFRYWCKRRHYRTSCSCHQRKNPQGKRLGNDFVVIGNAITIYSDESFGISETITCIWVVRRRETFESTKPDLQSDHISGSVTY
jgi:hypothetical protein